jgi:cysteinyl-tRNA synthetase
VDLDVPVAVADALKDDLNTPKAFAELAAIAKTLSTAKTEAEKAEAKGALMAAGKLMGFLQQDVEVWFKGGMDARIVEQKIAEMADARQKKDYKRSDEIRDELKQMSIAVSITPEGITGRKE